MVAGAAALCLAAWVGRQALAQHVTWASGKLDPLAGGRAEVPGVSTMEKLTEYKDASTYNNFYEFGTDKADPAKNAHTLKTQPWTVEVDGLGKRPARYTLEDLLKLSQEEAGISRLRGEGGWAMVVTWV